MTVLRTRGLLFDLDGVFVDSTASVEKHWRSFAERYDINPDELLTRVHGFPQTAIIPRELAHRPNDIDEALAIQMKLEEDDAPNDVALPGAATITTSLPAGKWAVVTSCWQRLAELRARAAGVALPAAVVTADQLERGKPFPEGYLRGAELLGLNAADCIVIEDAPSGIQAATSAGSRVIALRTTHTDNELGNATAVVDDLSRIHVEHDGEEFVLSLD